MGIQVYFPRGQGLGFGALGPHLPGSRPVRFGGVKEGGRERERERVRGKSSDNFFAVIFAETCTISVYAVLIAWASLFIASSPSYLISSCPSSFPSLSHSPLASSPPFLFSLVSYPSIPSICLIRDGGRVRTESCGHPAAANASRAFRLIEYRPFFDAEAAVSSSSSSSSSSKSRGSQGLAVAGGRGGGPRGAGDKRSV